MDEETSIVFELEKTSADAMNDGASNAQGIEEAPIGAESLNIDAYSKLLNSPLTKVATTRKAVTSTCIEKMMLLD